MKTNNTIIAATTTSSLHIASYNWVETNPYYNPDKVNNGGGYSQPTIELTFSDGVVIEINDTSCGDFGSRIWVTVEANGDDFIAHYGTMEPDQLKSEIPEKCFSAHLDIVENEFGYHIPTREYVHEVERAYYAE